MFLSKIFQYQYVKTEKKYAPLLRHRKNKRIFTIFLITSSIMYYFRPLNFRLYSVLEQKLMEDLEMSRK